jgi:hypothetical protein
MNAAPHRFEQKPLQSSARLISYAVASPDNSIAQDEAAQLVQHLGLTQRWNKAVPALYRKSGVQRRGSVLLEREEGDPHARQSFYPMRTDEKPYGPTTSERMLAYGLHSGPLLLRACREALDKEDLRLRVSSPSGYRADGQRSRWIGLEGFLMLKIPLHHGVFQPSIQRITRSVCPR